MFVLIYHDVIRAAERDSVGFAGPVAGAYKLDPEHFLGHLDALAATGVQLGRSGQTTPAMLTFDDGGASASWIAGELERRGWRGAFFVVTSRIGTSGFLDASSVRELAARGHEIGSHSHTHPGYMGRLPADAVAEEWCASRDALAELTGEPPVSAAVPGGSVSKTVIEQAARAGYRYLYTSTPRARVRRHGTINVIGRYTVWAGDPPELAASIGQGARLPRARRWFGWQAKSAAKRMSPVLYEAARSARARRAESRNDASRAT